MKVLVTGASGFIGHCLSEKLRQEGYNLVAAVRNVKKLKDIKNLFSEVRVVDFRKKDTIKNVTRDVDSVIHLAAHFKFHTEWRLLYETNFLGTKHLVEDAAKHKVEKFIYTSSTEAIGPVENIPATEDTPCNPSYDYGKSKLITEQYLKEKMKEGFPATIIRPTGVYGPRDKYVSYQTIKAINNGKLSFLPGKGDKYIQFTYVEDVVQGFVKALENEKSTGETYIISSDDYYTYKEAFQVIASILKVKPPEKTIPVWLATFIVGIIEYINRLKGVEDFVMHRSVVRDMQTNRVYSNEKAKKELGYKPLYNLRKGMQKTIQWYRQRNLL